MISEKDIVAAFKASGEKMNTLDLTIQEIKAYIDELQAQMKRYGKSLMSGTMKGEDHRGFWRDEGMARDFAGVILMACKREIAGFDTKDMSTSVGSEGGVLAPDDLADWVIQKMGTYGKFRKNAMPVRMGTSRQWVPRVSADLTIYAPGEGAGITKSDMEFGLVKLEAIKMACLTAISAELDEDAVVGMAEIVGMSMARSMAKKEDLIGFLGDGTETYFGMTGIVGALMAVDETIGNIKSLVVASGNAYSEITLADFDSVVGMLPEDAEDNARWFMSKKFFHAVVMPLARAAGVANIFEILSDRKARYLNGFPIEFVSCMPSTEANSQICAILGDLQMGAFLGERKGLELAKSKDVYFAQDQIGLRGIERVDINAHGVGDTTDPGAIVGLITAAA